MASVMLSFNIVLLALLEKSGQFYYQIPNVEKEKLGKGYRRGIKFLETAK
jgi:hypothetical protein